VEEQEDWRNDKWGGARPAVAQERRKRASVAIAVREKGMKEKEGAPGPRSMRTWVGRRSRSFFDLIKVVSNQIDLIEIKDGLFEI
jgi:hypothetical protein